LISPDKIEEVKNASDIVEIITGYLALKQSGSSFKGICPFHQEKTPSFMVSREKQLFKCFGCGQGGNVFTFVQRMENLSFVESVKMLAKRSGIEIEDNRRSTVDFSEKESLLKANLEAINYFHDMFLKSDRAKSYAVSRGLSEATIADFKIGFAPGEGGLSSYLRSKGISEDAALKSWLIAKGNTGTYDVFRDRFMFPIFNIYGDIIAFGGRAMDDSQQAKYINSKETSIYIKGRNLYNLNNARKFTDGTAVIVEGYMDCVTVYSAGIKNVVATLGTAMTPDQAKLLKRYAQKAVIMYDMDDAGRQGAVRAGNHLFSEGMDTYVVSFEEVKDPDDYIKKFGVEKLKEKIAKAEPFIDFMIEQLKKQGDPNNAYFKETVIKEVAALVSKSDSSIVRSAAAKKLADRLYLAINLVEGYFGRKEETVPQVEGTIDDAKALREKGVDLAEKTIIATAINSLGTDDEQVILKHIAERRELLGLKYEDFRNNAYSQIMQKIKAYFNAGEKEILKKVELDYVDNEDYNSIISGIIADKERRDWQEKQKDPKAKKQEQDNMQLISDCLQRIQKEKAGREMEAVNDAIRQAESTGDTQALKSFMEEKHRLQMILAPAKNKLKR
jgi:DNA primase